MSLVDLSRTTNTTNPFLLDTCSWCVWVVTHSSRRTANLFTHCQYLAMGFLHLALLRPASNPCVRVLQAKSNSSELRHTSLSLTNPFRLSTNYVHASQLSGSQYNRWIYMAGQISPQTQHNANSNRPRIVHQFQKQINDVSTCLRSVSVCFSFFCQDLCNILRLRVFAQLRSLLSFTLQQAKPTRHLSKLSAS